jgi:hypothetical protein
MRYSMPLKNISLASLLPTLPPIRIRLLPSYAHTRSQSSCTKGSHFAANNNKQTDHAQESCSLGELRGLAFSRQMAKAVLKKRILSLATQGIREQPKQYPDRKKYRSQACLPAFYCCTNACSELWAD